MIENIINKTKIGFAAITLSLSLYGCASIRATYPLAERISKSNRFYQCDEDKEGLYCDEYNVYPIVLVKFK